MKFQIPIYLETKSTLQDSTLFFSKQIKPPALQNILIPDMIQTLKPSLDGNRLTIGLKNDSKDTLHGVTIKLIPIESEFFELPPYLTGINEWKPATVIQAFHRNVGKNIKTIQLHIEDNRGNAINKRITL